VADAHPETSRGQVQDLADRLALEGWLVETGRDKSAPRVTHDLEREARAALGFGMTCPTGQACQQAALDRGNGQDGQDWKEGRDNGT
jgi:hypothetical protein